MRRKARTIAPMLLVLAVLGVVLWVNAGDLTPPPGPVGPTMHTLDEIYNLVASSSGGESRIAVNATNTPGDTDSLFKITQPGSYYLTGNVTALSGKMGIEIAADQVTLDLNGFALVGVAGSLNGVTIPGVHVNIAIRNGALRDWGGGGVSAGNASNSHFENLRASGNGAAGIQIGSGCVISGCAANGNTNQGITMGSGCTLTNCTAAVNNGTGFLAGDACSLAHCTAQSNTANGFTTGQGCSFASCSAASNGVDGFEGGNASSFLNCTAQGNTDDGFDSGQKSTITNCSARQNGGDGIYADGDTYVIGCNASNNSRHGIYADQGDTHIRHNTCNDNSGCGIYTSSGQYYLSVQGNHVVRNSQAGIRVLGERCFVVQNWAAGNNPNYDFAAGNHYGGIITSPGAAFSTSNAWANFQH